MYLESKASELGKPLMDMTLAEMDIFWEEAKRLL
jgi:XTP/dITP diphosphohydrolase